MEATNAARPLPVFDYVPTVGCEPSHSHAPVRSHPYKEQVREVVCTDRDGQSGGGNRGQAVGADALQSHHRNLGRPAKSKPFLVRGTGANLEALRGEPREEEYSTEIVATIARGYLEGIIRSAWKAKLREAQQVLTANTSHFGLWGARGEPHRSDPPPTVIWGQGQGKKHRGGLLDSRRPCGLQCHYGVANSPQGEAYYRFILAPTSVRS
ncbi:hypothetical protein Cgig2_012367 [Carnegiea gigantea]|uniref:Uncharacterized protein n=1 Tax=Carnegiea gigantea TaxID=171969 RepID=A0A9Q1QKG3_9CARY|nr:hypothetical protein Cgig2_012367 [Carnegiea gigantea]